LESDPDYSAVVYDFGNVLVEVDFARVVARWAELAGVDGARLRERFVIGDAYARHERGEIDIAAYYASLRRELGIDLDDRGFEEGWNAVFGEEISPTVEIVRRLAPVLPQYLFSNTNATHHAHFARRYAAALAPLRRLFLSHEIRRRKPEPEAFRHVAREIGVEPARILFFDDLEENVAGARTAGLQAVLVRSPTDVAAALQPWLGGSATRA
jgi:FMN phosphatase YigB (HAD superfamily)